MKGYFPEASAETLSLCALVGCFALTDLVSPQMMSELSPVT